MNAPQFDFHPPPDGHLGYFQFGVIMTKAALNILVQVIFWGQQTYVFISLG